MSKSAAALWSTGMATNQCMIAVGQFFFVIEITITILTTFRDLLQQDASLTKGFGEGFV